MPTIQELHIGSPGQSDEISASPADRAAGRRARARRRWIIRSGLTLVLTASSLCVFLVWQRDHRILSDRLREVGLAVQALQQRVDQLDGFLPATPPDSPMFPSGRIERGSYYASRAVISYAMKYHKTEPVIIAHTPRISLILGRDGRGVIVYDNGTVRQEWLSEREFLHTVETQNARMKTHSRQS